MGGTPPQYSNCMRFGPPIEALEGLVIAREPRPARALHGELARLACATGASRKAVSVAPHGLTGWGWIRARTIVRVGDDVFWHVRRHVAAAAAAAASRGVAHCEERERRGVGRRTPMPGSPDCQFRRRRLYLRSYHGQQGPYDIANLVARYLSPGLRTVREKTLHGGGR